MFVRKVFMEYFVFKIIIYDYVLGKIEFGVKLGTSFVIFVEIEVKVVKLVLEVVDMGFGISRGMFKVKIGQSVNRLKFFILFKNGVFGNVKFSQVFGVGDQKVGKVVNSLFQDDELKGCVEVFLVFLISL